MRMDANRNGAQDGGAVVRWWRRMDASTQAVLALTAAMLPTIGVQIAVMASV